MPSESKDTTFSKLKQFLQDQDFKGAENLLKQSQLPENLKKYNLGFVYYQKGDLVSSKKMFEQARLAGMMGPEVNASLELVNKELGVNYIEERMSFEDRVVIEAKSFPAELWGLCFLTLLFVALIFLYKKIYIGFSIFLSTLIGITVFYYQLQGLELNYNQEEKVIFQGPSAIFEEVNLLPPGLKYIVTKEDGSWSYIEHPAMFAGWIKKGQQKKD